MKVNNLQSRRGRTVLIAGTVEEHLEFCADVCLRSTRYRPRVTHAPADFYDEPDDVAALLLVEDEITHATVSLVRRFREHGVGVAVLCPRPLSERLGELLAAGPSWIGFGLQEDLAVFAFKRLGLLEANADPKNEPGCPDWAALRPVNPHHFTNLYTGDPQTLAVLAQAELAAPTAQTVLITGETGTGKDLLAHSIHDASGRAGRFVAANVSGLDDALFSDTLFGHVPGSYTGAISGRHGLVRRAENGTLFLDEIGDLSPASQTKLLRLLENREFYPIGSDRSVKTNARFVVATHRDLAARVREGSFRRDLYYRLRVQELDLPPLYQRECDLEPLARLFAERAAKDSGRPAPRLGPEFTRLLHTYSFPGNVRELLAMMHRAVALCPRDVLAHADFSPALEPIRAIRLRSAQDEAATEQPDAQAIRFMTEELPTLNRVVGLLVREALDRSGGNQSGAARLLGITPSAVNKRLRNAATEES